jgi:hypothetical protein
MKHENMKKLFLLLFIFVVTFQLNAQTKKYCVKTYNSKYEITLYDDGTQKGYFKLYDNYNRLVKTTQGVWSIRDEGVYGAAYMLTFDFTGVNSNLPSMKFTCQYDGGGQLQGLIDSQSRTWDMCW